MNKLKNKLKFQTKILLITIVSFIVITLAMLTYFFTYTLNTEIEKSSQFLNSMAITLANQFDSAIYTMDKTALQIASNPYMFDIFFNLQNDSNDNYFDNNLSLSKDVRDFIVSYNFSKNNNFRICAYNSKGDFVSAGSETTNKSDITEFYNTHQTDKLYNYFCKQNFTCFIPARRDPYNHLNDDYLYSVIRPIKNNIAISDEIYGFIEVQEQQSSFDNIFSELPDNMSALIFDSSDKIISNYSKNKNHQSLAQDGYLKNKNTKVDVDFVYEKMLMHITKLNNVDLSIVFVYDYRQNEIFSVWKIVFSLMFGILLLFCISQIILIRHLTKPLRSLHTSIQKISFPNPVLHVKQYDELQEIEQAFNLVLQQLQISMKKQIESEAREMETAFMALQSQMNPHFLYNILSTISLSAEEEKYNTISEICKILSDMLQFSGTYDSQKITLQTELDYVYNYLSLMKIRYENFLQYSVETNQFASFITIPKFIIQPLVENCFKHAFPEADPPWKIDIKININVDTKKWFVKIIDNGVGFDQSYLSKFKAAKESIDVNLMSQSLSSFHIGGMCIYNILYRMKMIYNNNFIFEIVSNDHHGSTVIIGGSFYD